MAAGKGWLIGMAAVSTALVAIIVGVVALTLTHPQKSKNTKNGKVQSSTIHTITEAQRTPQARKKGKINLLIKGKGKRRKGEEKKQSHIYIPWSRKGYEMQPVLSSPAIFCLISYGKKSYGYTVRVGLRCIECRIFHPNLHFSA